MNDSIRACLEAEIRSWLITARTGYGTHGYGNSPLCKAFTDVDLNCYGCPVYVRTRKHQCENTPYAAWHNSQKASDAAVEVDFLVSLWLSDEEVFL